MTARLQQISVHYSPDVLRRIGKSQDQLAGWTGIFRAWFHFGDPDLYFGRDVTNNPQGGFAYARHLHMVPSDETPEVQDEWESHADAHYRTSDRLVIYSLDRQSPYKQGMLILDLVGDPGGHALCFTGAAAKGRLQHWENLAYSHQVGGNLPTGAYSFTWA